MEAERLFVDGSSSPGRCGKSAPQDSQTVTSRQLPCVRLG